MKVLLQSLRFFAERCMVTSVRLSPSSHQMAVKFTVTIVPENMSLKHFSMLSYIQA